MWVQWWGVRCGEACLVAGVVGVVLMARLLLAASSGFGSGGVMCLVAARLLLAAFVGAMSEAIMAFSLA